MKKYNRIFVIVLDSLGIGAMPDSERFGDTDVDTFGHILERMQTLDIPNLTRLGMLNLHCGGKMQPAAEPIGRFTRLAEASNGKDTMTGHWEMMGIKTEKPFKTFTEHGFPPELIAELEKQCGKKVIGLSLIHISEPTRRTPISYAVFCLKKTTADRPQRAIRSFRYKL